VTEKFKDTKVVVRSRKSKKGRQYNGQKERDKKNNDIHNITQDTVERATRTPLQTWVHH